MNKLIVMSATVAMFAVTITSADAWTRNTTVSGPRGTTAIQGSGSCVNGICSRTKTVTGPYGSTATRQGSASCANGVCTRSSTTTRPNGNTINRQSSVYR